MRFFFVLPPPYYHISVYLPACLSICLSVGHSPTLSALVSLREDGLPLWRYFLWVGTGVGWVGGAAGLTGVLLLAMLVVMVACALPCVRKNGFFEVFYWSHHLFVPW